MDCCDDRCAEDCRVGDRFQGRLCRATSTMRRRQRYVVKWNQKYLSYLKMVSILLLSSWLTKFLIL